MTVAVEPTAKGPRVHVTTPFTGVVMQDPGLAVIEVNVAPAAGSVSLNEIVVAVSGPLFTMEKTKLAGLPTPTGEGDTVPEIDTPLNGVNLLRNASCVPFSDAWKGVTTGKFAEAVSPTT